MIQEKQLQIGGQPEKYVRRVKYVPETASCVQNAPDCGRDLIVLPETPGKAW